VGILGGGQLGRMLALAGRPLGLEFRFLESAADPPVSGLGPVLSADYDDPHALERLAAHVDVVTYEFENVPVEAARALEAWVPVHPTPSALEMAQDRLTEKTEFRRLGIQTAPFRPVDSLDQLRAALSELGMPAVLKTRRFGYDGKGQAVIRQESDVAPAWDTLGGVPLILEGFVDFERELSVVGVRGMDGEFRCYPLSENHHEQGILRVTRAPAPGLTPQLQAEGEAILRSVMESMAYVGVLAIELFQVGDHFRANEMAPRVHNSGHWTQDGASVSQFENHLRAVVGLPLGPTDQVRPSVMVNLLGDLPDLTEVLELPGAHLHLYGKAPRPGRKLGHVNIVTESEEASMAGARRLLEMLPAPMG
jgi:5-(carboxyamino)imidazole ribonucleotide synthase